jgi:predicted nucleic acid-binding protein
MTMAIFSSALEIRRMYGFSYWDSAIVAAARELGCDRVYTEDLSHGQRAGGVEIIDPFR